MSGLTGLTSMPILPISPLGKPPSSFAQVTPASVDLNNARWATTYISKYFSHTLMKGGIQYFMICGIHDQVITSGK